jgi:salicylate hydroxylase
MRLNLKGEFLKRFKYPFGSYRREDVLRVFVSECRKSPLVTLITSARVIHVEDLGSHVIAKTETGQIYEGDALIGCDGIWSIAREHILSSKEKPRISGQIIYRGVVAHKDMPSYLELGSIVHWVRPGCHLVHYPIGNKGMYNISAIFQTDRKPDPSETQGDKNELFAYFEGSRPEVMDLLERVDASRMWSLCDRNPISNWSKGRMTILGDAAHATLPYLTSGAGMAVEDAVVLAKKIEESGFRYEEAFKAYQKERYLRAAYVQYFSRAYGDVHHSSGVARELRNTLISERSEDENLDWVNYLYSGIEV